MNERFLSRGKRKDNGAWVEGYAFRLKEELDLMIMLKNKIGKAYEVIPETVGRCAGLEDKKGKLIFEGDIVESRASENKEDWKRWVVQFTDGSFCFEREIPRKRKYKYEQNLLGIDNIELYGLTVTGNVYDNLELLQRSEDE